MGEGTKNSPRFHPGGAFSRPDRRYIRVAETCPDRRGGVWEWARLSIKKRDDF